MDNILGLRMKERRKSLGIKIDKLAEMTGLSRATLYRYEKSSDNVPFVFVPGLAKALHCSVGYLMGWEDDVNSIADGILPIEGHEVPMLGEISCGKPIVANEEHEKMAGLFNGIEADFALKCRGDSMINARIHDGDIVFLKKVDGFTNGDIVAVVIDDETTLKRIYMDHINSICTLVPENPLYPTIRYQGEEIDHIRVIGKVVAFQSLIN